jgi:predicted nucleic acid-binding protein
VLVAYAVTQDINHEKAVRIINSIVKGEFGGAYTSDYIFAETVTVTLFKSKSVNNATVVGRYIKESTTILKTDEFDFEATWELFKDQNSPKFSFTDCCIISLARRYGIGEIATFDKEFKKIRDVRIIDNV